MKPLCARGAALLAAAVLASASAHAGPAKDSYLQYRAALAKATAPKDIAPFLMQFRREMLEGATAGELAKWFADYAGKRQQKDVAVTAETNTEQGMRLDATGVDARDGRALKAKVEMIAEGSAWKVKEELWYVELQPAKDPQAAKGDFARGTFTVNGKKADIRHVSARVKPYSFDETLPAVTLVFSDVAVEPGDASLWDRAKKGEVHYFELDVGPSMNVTSGLMYHQGYGDSGYMSMVGMHQIDIKTFGPTVIEGKASIPEKESQGKNTTHYQVEFRATVMAGK